jgi:polyisoprenoid-binding protein YceI
VDESNDAALPEDEPTPDAGSDEAANEAVETAAPTPTATPSSGPPPQWTIQPGGSLRFSVDNAGSAINGRFARWDGDIAMDPANPQTARIRITVNLASASLGDPTQDEMVRGAEFLAAGANPTASWRSTAVRALGGGRFEADGTLSLKGTSRAQRIRFTLSGEGAQRQVQGSATIDRNGFDVGTGPNAAGLGANVSLNFEFSASR